VAVTHDERWFKAGDRLEQIAIKIEHILHGECSLRIRQVRRRR
jgi:hypothetical protein